MNNVTSFLNRNAATILTCIGGIGVVGTVAVAIKDTPKAMQLLEEAKAKKKEELTKFEVVKAAAPAYVPTLLLGVGTLACIFGANAWNKHKQASLISAYALLDTSYKNYKQKVGELYGDAANVRVREEIAKDEYEENDISVNDDKVLFFDDFSGRYFESTIEAVQRAEYRINRELSMRDWATVNEFYDMLGLDHIAGGDDIGWSTGMNFDYYWQQWIDFNHEKVVQDDGLECYILVMMHEPAMGFDDY